jgi:hypothetical protein
VSSNGAAAIRSGVTSKQSTRPTRAVRASSSSCAWRRQIERIDGFQNPTAVTVGEKGAIYIAEVNGANVRKLVKAK